MRIKGGQSQIFVQQEANLEEILTSAYQRLRCENEYELLKRPVFFSVLLLLKSINP